VQLHAGQSDVFTNAATLNFTGTNVAVKLVNRGTTNIVASPGLSTNFNTPITQAAGNLNVAGTLNTANFAGVTLSGGTTTVDGTLNQDPFDALALTGGTLQGSGTIVAPSGVSNSGGTVHPGHSPGLLSITGDYTQTSGGTVSIDVAGTAPGTGYSQLAVSGNASIAGALHVNTTTPQTGTLNILTANSVAGTLSPVTFTGQTDTVAYTPTAVQVNTTAPPVATGPAMVTGSATVGSTLSSTHGSFSGNPTSYAYQWRDCDASGAGCTDVAGATASTYLVVGSDVGHTLVVAVTATNAGGSASVSSDPTAVIPPVSGPAPAPPVATGAPVVSGSATVGSTLSSTQGSFSGSPTSFAFQWLDCNSPGTGCTDISGATLSTYRVAGSDVGHALLVVVTANNAGGSASASSKQTAVVPGASVSPVISRLHLGSTSFTAAAGTTLVLDLSERATLTITVSRRVSGHMVRGHCSTRAKHGRRCSLNVAVRTITLNAIAGHNVLSLRFPGLKPGHYTMAVVAHDSSGQRSHPVAVSFVAKAP
ncbi:MAG: hypothetical protein M3071_13430, partial [Actinomycetota bacterium]|nr:hypothetical protein [Actinomycetota bacterium]